MTDLAGSVQTPAGSWCVIWTQARAEKKVAARAAAMGFAPWLPTVTEKRRWSDRSKAIVVPLFPGYLFARTNSMEWGKLLRIPGVLTIVKEGGRPALLRDDFVAGLRAAVERQGAEPEAVAALDYVSGDAVVVQDGLLKGFRGVIRECRNGRQLVVWIAEIGKGVALTIGSALVRPAPG